jgi:hypothetical protein
MTPIPALPVIALHRSNGIVARLRANGRVRQLACALLLTAFAAAGVLTDARPAAAEAACVFDTGAADDINSTQKDLNELCLSVGNDGGFPGCSSSDANLMWTWDDTGLTGSNSADACALYDTDGDGNANFALCTSIQSNPAVQTAGSPRFYACDNSKALNCGGASAVATAASACAVSNVADVFSATHQNGNPCTGGNCTTRDTQAQCCVKHADFPNGSTPQLLDVCSYPSASPSSSPTDCIKTVLCTADTDCSKLTDQCNVGTCSSDGVTKHCVATPTTDSASCDDGNACTTGDTCANGVCGGTKVSCDDGNACTDDTCNGAGGCNHTDHVGACDDGNACTTGDTCSNGVCDGSTFSCDDKNPCTNDSCDATLGCVHAANSASCDDGSACTSGDTCSNGVCGGTAISCDDGNPCTDDTCNAAGGCGHPDHVGACNDGNACTTGDTCNNGICAGTTASCDDGNPCTDDSCDATLGCVHAANSASCDDGNACTTGDVCNAGNCAGTSEVVCGALDGCHEAGTCDPATGQCSNPVKADGATCDDGNGCTATDRCEAGSCVGADSVVCAPTDLCHDAGTCDPATGQCSSPVKADGTHCNDANECTANDVCTAGTCGGSAVVDGTQCDDDNSCTSSDSCQAGTCVGGSVADNGTPCDDSDSCTQTDTCQDGACAGSDPLADGTPCDDGSTCTSGDICQAGACTGTAAPNGTACTDANSCTGTDACYAGVCLGLAEEDGTVCDDSNGCTQDDTCGNGTCSGADPVVCEALDGCHEAGVCDPTSGTCSNPVKPSGATCSDGDACTSGAGSDGGDHCDGSGQCIPGTPVVCAAADACHEAGTCDPATGQCSFATKPSGTPCSDGNACSGAGSGAGDQCDGSGQCVPGAAVECPADACHEAGTCDPATGQCSAAAKASGTPCSDGNACTGAGSEGSSDQCDGSGQCVSGAPVECPAADACHEAGVCDPATGECSVAAKPNGTPCSDGNACTGGAGADGDRCDADGQCVPGTPVVCTASDDCHEAGTCDPATGTCSAPVKAGGSTCSDGNPCTLGDVCNGNGTCSAGAPRDCSTDDPCHESGSCDVTTGSCVVTPKAVDCGDAVCSEDPACVEICDNCIDDDGDGQIDRDDPKCMPYADGLGVGTGDPKKRGAGVAKCQSSIQKAGIRLATVTRVRLQQCADAVFRCVQQKADDPTCLTKARARCIKQATALADGPGSLTARLRIKIAKSCGPKKAGLPPRVSRDDLCAATGLGFLGELTACDDPNTPAAGVLDEITDHLVHEERCRIAELFTASTPRGVELLSLGDLHMTDGECLDGARDGGALGLGSPAGKTATKCQKTIGASSTKFFNKVTGSYRRCAAAVFKCVQQKSSDPRCRAKAERRCQKLTANLFEGPRSVETRMRTSIARACGPRKGKPVLLGLAQLSDGAGLGYGALEGRCNALGVSTLQSLDDVGECIVRQYVCRAEQVLTGEMPRTHELLDLGKAHRR